MNEEGTRKGMFLAEVAQGSYTRKAIKPRNKF